MNAIKCALSAALLLAILLTSGCETTPPPPLPVGLEQGGEAEVLKPGDLLKITFKGAPRDQIADHVERIPASGEISLPLVGKVTAIGKTRVELQDEIQRMYVPAYYRSLNVTIVPEDRFFFVYGDVKLPNRYLYVNKLTVTAAVSTAGGFTDFANRKKVQVTRADGTIEVVNCSKALENPSYDREVLPGDKIFVPRRSF